MALIGTEGPAVVLDARTCAWLERYAALSSLRVRVRGTDPSISKQLEEIHQAALSWGSATGTEVATQPEPAAGSQWLSTTEAADLLGIGPRAVVKAIARGALPGTRVGNRWRVSREDVQHYRAA